MKTYTQDEVKYKVVNAKGDMIGKRYFEDICDAEREAMLLTDFNYRTKQMGFKYEKAYVICMHSCAEYTTYEDIGITVMTNYTEKANVCREAKLGMIRVILNKYIE